MNNSKQRVLAIDPGRNKCGIAVYDQQQGVRRQAIVTVDNLTATVEAWSLEYACSVVVIGNKTASKQIIQILERLVTENIIESIVTVNEHKSTEEARLRYWKTHPPRGWRKIIPIGLLSPPCAIDDFAAIILGERYFSKNL